MTQKSKPFSEELVRDAENLIVNEPSTVRSGARVIEAVEAMVKDPRTETVYVVDLYNRLKGIITVNDLLKVSSIQMGATKRTRMLNFFSYMGLLYSETVDDIMRKPVTIGEDDKLIDALNIMESKELTDLPVVDKNNILVAELNGLEMLTVILNKIKTGDFENIS